LVLSLLGQLKMTKVRTKVVAYATVIEEMLPLLPQDVTYEVFDFGLHRIPEKLRSKLQEAIDIASATADTVILGCGLCVMAVVGLKATACALVVSRVDAFPYTLGLRPGSDRGRPYRRVLFRQNLRESPGAP
jgi:hypothetical protein